MQGCPRKKKLRSVCVCGIKKGKSDHYHREVPQPMDGDVAWNQMDFMFIGAEGTFVDEPRARATVLMVICKDDGNLSATEVRTKTGEYGMEMVLRFLSLDQYNVTLCLTGHYQEGDGVAREQFHRFGRKLVRRPSVFSKCVDAQH